MDGGPGPGAVGRPFSSLPLVRERTADRGSHAACARLLQGVGGEVHLHPARDLDAVDGGTCGFSWRPGFREGSFTFLCPFSTWRYLIVSERAVHVIDWTLDHGVAIILLQGEVVWACRDKYEDTVRDALNLNKWPLLVVNVENADFVDTNIIASMVQRQRVLKRMGGGLVLYGESKGVTAATSSLGVSAMLPVVFSSLRDARNFVVEGSVFTESQIRTRRV